MPPKIRIDFDPDSEPLAQLVRGLADYQRSWREKDYATAAQHAHRCERLITQLTNHALSINDEHHPRQRREMARRLGLAHATVNDRIVNHRDAELGLRPPQQPQQADHVPAHLYLVNRRADSFGDPEFLSLHRTRRGAEMRALDYNDEFGHGPDDPFRATVRRVNGQFQQQHPTTAPEIEE